MSEQRNTEARKAPDITDWLRERRDEAAAKRSELFAAIAARADAVKSGAMTVEAAAALDAPATIEANAWDALALWYFTALTEIEKNRLIVVAMTKSLKERGHYCPEEPVGR